MSGQEKFPDGTPIPDWFRQNEIVNIDTLGKKYTITDYGVANDSTILQTEKIQAVIDRAAENGGGVIIIPKGTFLSGSIFFKPKTHLYMEEGAVLKGSDDISNFAIVNTRIEGQSLKYFQYLCPLPLIVPLPEMVNPLTLSAFTIPTTVTTGVRAFFKACFMITFQMASAILSESSLSFLGMGVQPPGASWGNMLYDAQSITVLSQKLWIWLPPGLALLITVLSINFLGDGIRDALDPKIKL